MSTHQPPRPYTTITGVPELTAAWRALMGDGGFAKSTLWIMMLDDRDRLHPLLLPIEPLPAVPAERFVRNLARVLGDLVDCEGGSVALLLSRPGPAEMSAEDRAWAAALRRHLEGPLARWPLHLATRDRVQAFAPDDLVAA